MMKVLKLKSKQEGMGTMGIIKLIKDSTIASSIVFLGATVGTVGIVSGTAFAGKPQVKPSSPTTVVVLVNSPVNVATVSNTTVQGGITGDVFYSANSQFGNTSNEGNIASGYVSNSSTSTITVNQ